MLGFENLQKLAKNKVSIPVEVGVKLRMQISTFTHLAASSSLIIC